MIIRPMWNCGRTCWLVELAFAIALEVLQMQAAADIGRLKLIPKNFRMLGFKLLRLCAPQWVVMLKPSRPAFLMLTSIGPAVKAG